MVIHGSSKIHLSSDDTQIFLIFTTLQTIFTIIKTNIFNIIIIIMHNINKL